MPGAPRGLHISVSSEGVRSAVSRGRIADAVRLVLTREKVREALVSVTLLSRGQMARLNQRHLGHRGATDAISFGFRDPAGALIGDLYLCPELARENAHRFGVGVREELLRLAIHATLHAVGYDHPTDDTRTGSPMWRRQEALLRSALTR